MLFRSEEELKLLELDQVDLEAVDLEEQEELVLLVLPTLAVAVEEVVFQFQQVEVVDQE